MPYDQNGNFYAIGDNPAYQIPKPMAPLEARQMDTLTQRVSRQTPGGYPILPNAAPAYRTQDVVAPAPYIPSPGAPNGPLPPSYGIINQPVPSSPVPGMENFAGFDPALMERITAILAPQGLTPEQLQAIDILKGVGTEATNAAIAREQSRALQSGRGGSSLEQNDIARALTQGTSALQASIAPILQQSAEMAQQNRVYTADFLKSIGTLDAANKRDALIRFTDRQVQAGQFDINNLINLRATLASLVDKEMQDLRAKGLKEAELAQQKEIRLRELDQSLEEIRLRAALARQGQGGGSPYSGFNPGYPGFINTQPSTGAYGLSNFSPYQPPSGNAFVPLIGGKRA